MGRIVAMAPSFRAPTGAEALSTCPFFVHPKPAGNLLHGRSHVSLQFLHVQKRFFGCLLQHHEGLVRASRARNSSSSFR